MERINIESLFNCKTHNNSSKTLDIKSISQPKKSFDIENLIETRERKRKRLLNYYLKFHENCLKKIEIANNLAKTDLLYSVTPTIINFPEYNSLECIKYIKNKLDQEYFDTYIVDENTLFITWLYLEVNREKLFPSRPSPQ